MNIRLISWFGLSIATGVSLFVGCTYEPPQQSGTSSSSSSTSSSGSGGSGGATTSSSGLGGEAGQGGGSAGSGGQAGAGGSVTCTDGQTQLCYDGPPNAKDKGLCTPVEQTCEKGTWEPCSGFYLPTSEDCSSSMDTNCDGQPGCTGTPIKAGAPDGMMPGDDMIYDMVTTPPAGPGYDGMTFAVGARNADILGSKFPNTHSDVLFWTRGPLGSVKNWSDRFTFTPTVPNMGIAFGSGVARNSMAKEIIIVGNILNGKLAVQLKPHIDASAAQNAFITIMDEAGNAKNAMPIGTVVLANSGVVANGIAVDSAGNIYVAGHYWGSPNFGDAAPAPQTTNANGFVVSYTGTGVFRWQTFFNGTWAHSIDAVRVNEADEIFIAGRIGGAVSFNLNGGTGWLTPSGGSDVLLAKIDNGIAKPDNAGGAMWAVTVGGDNHDFFGGLAASKDGVALAGMFRGHLSIGGFGATSSDQFPYWDTYVATFDKSNGSPKAATAIVANGNQFIQAVAVDSFGDIVIAGTYSSTLPNNAGTLVTSGMNDFDAFVVKIGSNFAALWAKDFGDTLDQAAHAVVIGPTTGHVIIGGGFQGALDGFTVAPPNANGFDAFIGELAN